MLNQPRVQGNSPTDKLIHYVIINDAAGVSQSLAAGAKADGTSKGLRTPLHVAALNGHLEIVRLLCEHNASTSLRSILDRGMQPLHLAAKNGHAPVVEELITRGADCRDRYYKGMEAVHTAASHDHVQVLEVLVWRGCDLNTTGRDGSTPLHLAAQHGCLEAARWLADHSASLTAKNNDLLTPEDMARRSKHLHLANMLAQYQEMDEGSTNAEPSENIKQNRKTSYPTLNKTPTTPNYTKESAARKTKPVNPMDDNDVKGAKPIITKVKIIQQSKQTGRHMEPEKEPARANDAKKGSPFNYPAITNDAKRRSPVHKEETSPSPPPPGTKPHANNLMTEKSKACQPQHDAKWHQAVVDEETRTNHKGVSPCYGVKGAEGYEEPRGAENMKGQHTAAKWKNEFERDHGRTNAPEKGQGRKTEANKGKRNNDECDYDKNNGKNNNAKNDQRRETDGEVDQERRPITAANDQDSEEEDDEGVLYRLHAHPEGPPGGAGSSSSGSGSFHNASDPAEEELIEAVSAGMTDTVDRLLAEGVSTEARSRREGEKGLRPLHLAAWSGHEDIVRLLLDHQPNGKAMAHGLSAVHWAAVGGHCGVLQALWEQGFSVKCRAEDGATALHLAADHDNLEAVRWLAEKGALLQVKDKRGNTPRDLAKQAGNKTIYQFLKEKEQEMRLENMTEKRKLGEGSFGDVYLVRTGSRQVVVKKINLQELTRKQQEYAHREFKVLKTLVHPYIVAYKGGGFQGRCLHIHMEYCSGGDLANRIDEQRGRGTAFQERTVFNWVLRICLALKFLHGRKLLHRDIKPHNIFLTGAGQIKLGDFGLVRVFGEDSVMADTSLGTPAYMSPEIFQGVPYDSKADMWSLGCCCYELAALERGFPYIQVEVPGEFRPEYKDLVVSLLQRDPDQRPSASQILGLPFMVELMGWQLEAREEEADGLTKEVQELTGELTEATQELNRLREALKGSTQGIRLSSRC